jgi:hypothetical protein
VLAAVRPSIGNNYKSYFKFSPPDRVVHANIQIDRYYTFKSTFVIKFIKFIDLVSHVLLKLFLIGSSMTSVLDECHTNEEKPGKGARDRAILFMTIWPPFKLITALPSGSESV